MIRKTNIHWKSRGVEFYLNQCESNSYLLKISYTHNLYHMHGWRIELLIKIKHTDITFGFC